MLSTENKRHIYFHQEEISTFWNHDARLVRVENTYLHMELKYVCILSI